MIALEIIFWLCVLGMLHSYLFYPLIVYLLSLTKKQNGIVFEEYEEMPTVSVLLAVHNEEEVISEKIETTMKSRFPPRKIEFLIGSDASTDATDKLIEDKKHEHPQIRLYRLESRTGKAAIMNELAHEASGGILILTDANVLFTESTIEELVRHFKNPTIAVVAGNITSKDVKHHGIGRQESAYQRMENNLKYREGILWGAMMGAFGGCYAIRKKYFSPTPPKYIVDDFYITMAALEMGGKAISEPKASCHEDVSHSSKEEFRRKTRIATGNFQIIGRFMNLLSPLKGGIAFAFFSHKVLRWLGPFFIVAGYLSSFGLSFTSDFYRICFVIQTILLLIPLGDLILRKLNVHWFGLRSISHFYMMNLALLNGFFKFLTGVKHNVWQPTQRNQSQRDAIG